MLPFLLIPKQNHIKITSIYLNMTLSLTISKIANGLQIKKFQLYKDKINISINFFFHFLFFGN